MSDINEIKARVRRWADCWTGITFAVSAPSVNPVDVKALLADHDRLEAAENAMTIPKTYAEAKIEACEGCRKGLAKFKGHGVVPDFHEWVPDFCEGNNPKPCTAPTRDSYEARLVEEILRLKAKMSEEKIPLGLEPGWIWKQKRIEDLLAAMQRYAAAKKPCPLDWIDELRDHVVQTVEKR